MSSSKIFATIMDLLYQKHGETLSRYDIPPPVFTLMDGEFVSLDLGNQTLIAKFPVYKKYLNPYQTMQGGIIAAAVDNTLGPLSMLVSPPNVTRRLEMKYSHPVTLEYRYITVLARLVERIERWLTFSAEVRNPENMLIAKARAIHWIVDDEVTEQ